MNKNIMLFLAAILPISPMAETQDWKSCAENVEAWMRARNECGASHCVNEQGTLEEHMVKQCGYPEHTPKEIAEIIKAAKSGCRMENHSVKMNSFVERSLVLFPPTHPVHKKVMDQCLKNK
jgi:hypothetical protein